MERLNGFPLSQGLYDQIEEKDSCGVGFVADIKGTCSHEILKHGLKILANLKHRGAVGADSETGDGSGIMLQIPHEFFQKKLSQLEIKLPEKGSYAAGMMFLPQEPNSRLFCEGVFERILREEDLELLGWREVPISEEACGELAIATRPVVMQVFIHMGDLDKSDFERRLYLVRKRVQNTVTNFQRPYTESFYICSLSCRTIVYKGLVLGSRLDLFYPDLQDEAMKTAIAIVHERYSTNTFPSWSLAQPFRYLAHNGEINTIRGNINWMNAREGVMESRIFGEDFQKTLPVIEPGGSDSASLDNMLELFVTNGHPMSYVMMMLIPEAWQNNRDMPPDIKAFYEYTARIMEPWDGPATIVFCNGVQIGVVLDRNGLRPARYIETRDGLVIMASEAGVVNIPPGDIIKKGRVEPGRMLLIDTSEGRIVPDEEIKQTAASRNPTVQWIQRNKLTLRDICQPYEVKKMRKETLLLKQKIFGYTEEDLKLVIPHMARYGEEPIASMGMDTPLAVLSEHPQMLFSYFKQSFAQVTNPPIDPIREKSIMSLIQFIGTHGTLLDEIETETDRKYIELQQPILGNREIEDIRHLYDKDFKAITIPAIFAVDQPDGLKNALDFLCKRAEESLREGFNIIILSDRNTDRFHAPVPSLLALGAVHHHLIRKKLRTFVDILMEAGDARDVMHIALLIGYGATAVNPYMVFDTIASMAANEHQAEEGCRNYINAVSTGLLKVISRMGISTLQSYCGAQIFQILGLSKDIVASYFTGTTLRLPCLGLSDIAREVIHRFSAAYENKPLSMDSHIFSPQVAACLHKACVNNTKSGYIDYLRSIEETGAQTTIRGLLAFKKRTPIPIDEVESVEEILKRFTISGMSFGAISKEAHEAMAAAMNSIGGTSNSGEGGEDPIRFLVSDSGLSTISRVKQVASARFGVSANYLVNCDELQIKIAQGAKPGEGGHLPGKKVTREIAKVRRSLPGIDLISPPPHHDIYSIEDLAQLIFDLKNINPTARIGVKLVSEAGIGAVAAGVAKAMADVVMISGHDGSTGASPVSSMKYVGMPWEIGLAETQQTLLLNNLRDRVILQVDGKLRSGRDVVIAALLGAESYGFATTALISLGCRMCRHCHQDKCPAGICTQDPNLRGRFHGKPEHLVNFVRFVAEEAREIMSQLGFRSIDDMIGRVDMLEAKDTTIGRHKNIDLSALLYKPELPSRITARFITPQKHRIDEVLDRKLLLLCKPALEQSQSVSGHFHICNSDRTIGTMLSGEIARRYGDVGLPEDTIKLGFTGSAGQSFGAFAAAGVTLILEGEANDYVGKGLSGGKIILTPPKSSSFAPDENIIAGNTLLYGATSGHAYICGMVGQRFCVRNSGATAVVEGIGDHGCEYMTGGTVLILGPTGRNFGAGMSGGIAYVLDESMDFAQHCQNDNLEIKQLDYKHGETVKKLLQSQFEYTNSPKAKRILEQWHHYGGKFLIISTPLYQQLLAAN